MFALALIFTEIPFLIVLFLAQLPLIYSAKVQKEWLNSIRGGVTLIAIIFATNMIVGYVSNGYVLTSSIVIYSASLAFRFIVLMSSFSIFFLTTSPDDLSLALQQSHIPYEFCFAFTTAIRFVPVLATEAQTIMDAQKSRGLELEKGNFLKRIRNFIPILIPLIVGAIRRSLELAEAMESRAFGAKKERTSLYVLRIRRSDWVTMGIGAAILAASLYVRSFIPLTFLSLT
ncbi:energy-coupling factor transporter transmembrane protein EcfT [Candidatus Bathyarchaeota archaeon]|jgi:energy-coupling factor transport system permease protein|nr:energy-coupling factor transporter transmembrane protein EcfT [Candidatus Bathyarchaeota archaeon]